MRVRDVDVSHSPASLLVNDAEHIPGTLKSSKTNNHSSSSNSTQPSFSEPTSKGIVHIFGLSLIVILNKHSATCLCLSHNISPETLLRNGPWIILKRKKPSRWTLKSTGFLLEIKQKRSCFW